MSIDLLSSSGDEFSRNNATWRRMLTFAEMQGFDWPKTATGDERESLDEAQSRNLANAIEHGLGIDGPDRKRISQQLGLTETEPIGDQVIACWREFVAFARQGAFSISI